MFFGDFPFWYALQYQCSVSLMSLDLLLTELVISASVLVLGVLLAPKAQLSNRIVIGLAATAGIFCGFAIGGAIFGAEIGLLISYLLGIAAIQLATLAIACWIGKTVLKKLVVSPRLRLRFSGVVIYGIDLTALMTIFVDSLFPA
ncbi:MAG: HupE/UreJ family protein [Cyanobacteria bacterium P01_F01_bin.150]